MNLVKDLQINPTTDCVEWIYESQKIAISLSQAGQALEDKVNHKIIVSVTDGKYPKLLKIYNLFGDEECTVKEPQNFQFYFLREHSTYGVSVVCSSREPIDGRFDWQFFIAYPNCELRKFAPSY